MLKICFIENTLILYLCQHTRVGLFVHLLFYRSNLGSAGIKEHLEDAGMPNNRVSRLLTSHKVKHKSIKAELSRIRPSFSSILDVKWTLEYVRGHNAGAQYQVREIILFVQL